MLVLSFALFSLQFIWKRKATEKTVNRSVSERVSVCMCASVDDHEHFRRSFIGSFKRQILAFDNVTQRFYSVQWDEFYMKSSMLLKGKPFSFILQPTPTHPFPIARFLCCCYYMFLHWLAVFHLANKRSMGILEFTRKNLYLFKGKRGRILPPFFSPKIKNNDEEKVKKINWCKMTASYRMEWKFTGSTRNVKMYKSETFFETLYLENLKVL